MEAIHVCIGVENGGEEAFETVANRQRRMGGDRRQRMLAGMACTSERWIMQRYSQFVYSK